MNCQEMISEPGRKLQVVSGRAFFIFSFQCSVQIVTRKSCIGKNTVERPPLKKEGNEGCVYKIALKWLHKIEAWTES